MFKLLLLLLLQGRRLRLGLGLGLEIVSAEALGEGVEGGREFLHG